MLKGFYLTLLIGPVVPIPAPPPVIEALTGVQVTTAAGQRSGFQLTFAVSKQSPLQRVLLAAGFFDAPMRVIIIVTINGLPNVLMDGVITRHEFAPSNELGQSTLTVTGEDVSLMMDLIDMSGLPYPAMPVEARVALIIAKYAMFGMIPLVIPSLFVDVPIPTDKIPSHEGTDLAYINKLAADAGYVFYIEAGPAPGTNVAYWGPQIKVGVPQPALNIDMDAHTNVESLSFSMDGTQRKQLVVFVQEPITKLNLPIPVPDVGLLNPPLALRPPLPLRFEQLRETAKLNPLGAAALGLARTAASSDPVTGNGQLDVLRYGRVLRARQLVGVRGAGLAYDGLYYVQRVTHNIKRSEYKQSFSLTRNGLISSTPVVPV